MTALYFGDLRHSTRGIFLFRVCVPQFCESTHGMREAAEYKHPTGCRVRVQGVQFFGGRHLSMHRLKTSTVNPEALPQDLLSCLLI